MQTRYVGVWHIDDNGRVPPRFTIGGPDGVLRQGRGLALDPKNHTVIASDKELNAVLTFQVPEIFGSGTASPVVSRESKATKREQ
jgi:hypothetical protein